MYLQMVCWVEDGLPPVLSWQRCIPSLSIENVWEGEHTPDACSWLDCCWRQTQPCPHLTGTPRGCCRLPCRSSPRTVPPHHRYPGPLPAARQHHSPLAGPPFGDNGPRLTVIYQHLHGHCCWDIPGEDSPAGGCRWERYFVAVTLHAHCHRFHEVAHGVRTDGVRDGRMRVVCG